MSRSTTKLARLMAVDDDAAQLEVLRLWLENSGYEVVTARDGFEAIAHMREGCFDVVITDQMMPGLSGLQLLTILKELNPAVAVVFLTGRGTMQDAIEALREGRAFDFLQKPLKDLHKLNLVIEKAISHTQQSLRITSVVTLPAEARPPLPPHIEMLTPQELSLVALLAEGHDNRTIAEKLHFSEKTVRNYLSRAYEKLGVANRLQAVAFCRQYGLLEPLTLQPTA